MDRLRVVQVGCGGISRAWTKSESYREFVELVGVVDVVPEAAKRLIAELELPDVPIGADLTAMIEQVLPEAIFDTTVPEGHHPVTTAALARGCHVLGEKPLADTLEHAREMVAVAERTGRTYAVTQTRRWNAQMRRVESLLRSGEIGSPRSLYADFVIAAHFGGFRANMRHVLLLDMAIHTFDTARVLVGDANPAWVLAHESNPTGSNYRHGADAMAHFGFTDGTVFSYRGTWTGTGQQTSWEADWNIQCTRGAVTWRKDSDIVAQRMIDPLQPSAEDGSSLIRDLEDVDVPEFVADGLELPQLPP